ncbi:MAG: MBL fold metallo-hydrolase, partial [Verrucomicrobiota bacterium]
LVLRLESVGVDPDTLSGILLTHEHGDHTRGLEVFLRKRRIPIYGNIRTAEYLRQRMSGEVEWMLFESGDGFPLGNVQVKSFYVPHDAVEPMGFVLQGEAGSMGIVSDVGHVTTLVQESLRGVDSLYVEANYDDLMLQNDTKRPWSTKQRISSRHGHLSNAQTAELVRAIATPALHQVVLGHLSQDCNSPEVAMRAVSRSLEGSDALDVEIRCAPQNEVLEFRSVRRQQKEVSAPVLGRSRTAQPCADRTKESRAWEATQETLFEF